MLKAGFYLLTVTFLLLAGQRVFACIGVDQTDRSGSDCADSDCTFSCTSGPHILQNDAITPPELDRRHEDAIRLAFGVSSNVGRGFDNPLVTLRFVPKGRASAPAGLTNLHAALGAL